MRLNLKNKMEERNVALDDLAEAIGKGKSFIYKILADTRNPRMVDAKKIADFLGTTVDSLFFAEEIDETSIEPSAQEAI